MKVGVIVIYNKFTNIKDKFKKLKENNFDNCQLICWDNSVFTEYSAKNVLSAKEEFNIDITAIWCGWQQPAIWDFYDGPLTLGLVPETYRFCRCERILEGAAFGNLLGIKDVITHAGFLPEDPNNKDYIGVISSLKHICKTLKKNNQNFLFETGQETPITLLRAIEDIGLDNVGINIDPANLLLYGKANPVDAVYILGSHIKGVHAKDGEYPTTGRYLGEEKQIGKGKVNFPLFIKALKEVGYTGSLTIENEMGNKDHHKEILEAKSFLENIIKE